ncbi:DUF6973 domain-containing protein [Thiopseudomonas acetoxidans]|uniref:DUF6973 domain-containing protein n=1 Tax=Thiopseudomonas acetoxidans TaxID=3041622 RepID=A0ABT7SNE7_9GAMM|nr:hypothetical protein [Thiopseudomonas sp. CY1220]MDM7857703.1 hypothetical protein [Thiopseudomonas sp. CY1220]
MKYLGDLQNRSAEYSNKYGLDGPINGAADAFRHAYSSAEMTRDFGPQSANHAGTWWEILGLIKGQSEAEARMDAWNNYVGQEIAIKLGPNATNDELAEAVYDAVLSGRLVLEPKPGKNPLKELWEQAKNWVMPRDPIILDLDGNGLQTVGLTSNIYFDHNGDGILSKTGWVGEGDALLVWDRNANGLIDNGAELFGDFTPMPDGSLAPNGFAALAALDANGDGILDASDPAFAELKLWVDSDQNGTTGEGELISLADAGIASLNLGNSLKNQKQSNGNTLAREGSFTRTDGTESAMGEFHLAIDTFDTQFAESIEVPESLRGLPMMNGSGNVRDLQQAA